jgi:Ca-activated chloride channel family protein
MRKLGCLCTLLLAPVLAAGAAVPARAQSAPTAVIVMDGSGSMWGTLGAERLAKFDLVRAQLRQSLATVSPEARLGLVSFGHRRRGDCTDAEAIAAPEAGPPDRIPALVDKLNPRGKGPLVLALKEAAKLADPGSPASLLVIHDGPDNCQQDPCLAAAEIARTNPNLTVHVVGLAPEPADARYMRCVVRATKGKLFEARDAPSLAAAIDEALNLANLRAPTPAAPAETAGAPLPGTAPTAGPPGLRLSATLAASGAPLSVPVSWRVAKDGVEGEVVLERAAPELAADLAPGTYRVTASLGLAAVEQSIPVTEKGPTSLRLALNAGTLKVAARANGASEPVPDPLITIYTAAGAAQDGEGPHLGPPLWIGRDPDAELVVPAGTYHVRVEAGLASRSTATAVTPGGRANAELVLGTGRLELDAVAYAGAEPLTRVVFTISEDDPDSPQGRREVARSASPNPSFVLPPGTYYVAASHGAAEGRERIAIGSGDLVKRTLVLGLARLSLSLSLNGAPPPPDQPVTYVVLSSDAAAHEVARSTRASPEFLLPQGRYRVEAQAGTLNVRTEVEADLVAGKETKIALKLDSAQVTIKPTAGENAARRWELRDTRGRTLLRSGQGGTRSARLAPGHYVVKAESGGQRSETIVELKPGEERTVELAVR